MNKIIIKILKKFSTWVIKKNDPQIIAITGSVGKTSTKDAIYIVLENKYQKMVAKSYGNLNTEFGVPLSILRFEKAPSALGWMWVIPFAFLRTIYFCVTKNYPKILVLEYGADKPGDIQYLCQIAQPDIAVVTHVGPAHLEAFKTVDNIAREKMKLAVNLKADGTAILNSDNEYIKKYSKKVFHNIIWYKGNELNSEDQVAKIIAKIFKIDENTVTEILSQKVIAKGRLNVLDGINNSFILDDTYNSNPLSVERALQKIVKIKETNKDIKKIIVVLGDMLELGEDELKLHKEVFNRVKKISKNIFLVGERFKDIKCNKWFLSPIQAGNYIKDIVKNGDLVLVKGSQGMRMEKVVEKIIKDRDNKRELLVRQSDEWKRKDFVQP